VGREVAFRLDHPYLDVETATATGLGNVKHTILGCGPVGCSAMTALAGRGEQVQVVSRQPSPQLPSGVTHQALDVLDRVRLEAACRGSDVIYQCLSAPYHRWAAEFPPLQEAVVRVAKSVGARLVSFDNVYMYGAPGAEPFGEDHPNRPCSEKGRVRAAMAEELHGLHARRELLVAQVRASDLFGPGMRDSALGEQLIGRAVAGKTARGFGNLSMPHTWAFTLDAGETLARVGLSADAFGKVWHVPSDEPRSQNEIAQELSTILQRSVTIEPTPAWVLRVVGLFQPKAGAMVEMAYEFEQPFVVADSAARRLLGQSHTPFHDALGATVRSFATPSTEPVRASARA